MKKWKTAILWLVLTSLLTGCAFGFGKTDPDATGVVIDKKGAVTQFIVEGFEQPYYNVAELETEITTKAGQYNQQVGNEEAVVLEELTLSEDKQIKAKIKYAGAQDYSSFNERTLFVGTVSEAYQAGYTFTDMKQPDGQILTAPQVLEKGDMHIVILEEAQQVRTPSPIAYFSDGMNLMDEKSIMNLNEGQIAFVIYE